MTGGWRKLYEDLHILYYSLILLIWSLSLINLIKSGRMRPVWNDEQKGKIRNVYQILVG
jgi:hypothetical protein